MLTREIVRSRAISRPKSSKNATQWEIQLEGKGKRWYRVNVHTFWRGCNVAYVKLNKKDQRLSEGALRGLRAVQVAS